MFPDEIRYVKGAFPGIQIHFDGIRELRPADSIEEFFIVSFLLSEFLCLFGELHHFGCARQFIDPAAPRFLLVLSTVPDAAIGIFEIFQFTTPHPNFFGRHGIVNDNAHYKGSKQN